MTALLDYALIMIRLCSMQLCIICHPLVGSVCSIHIYAIYSVRYVIVIDLVVKDIAVSS